MGVALTRRTGQAMLAVAYRDRELDQHVAYRVLTTYLVDVQNEQQAMPGYEPIHQP